MAVGSPIIGLVDNHSEIGKTITRYNCGKIWGANNDKGLAQLLTETLEDEQSLINMRENSLKGFCKNFDLSISSSKYLDLINN